MSMIGVPNPRIERELEHFREIRVGKTASRRVLGVMNDLAFHFQLESGDHPSVPISLSNVEFKLASMPQATLTFQSAAEVALGLLKSGAGSGAA